MDGFLLARMLGDWLFGISTLISIINPIGIAFVFHAVTRDLPRPAQRRLAARIAIYGFCVLVISMAIGARVLNLFGISLEALRIAGGLVVSISGWAMLSAEETQMAGQEIDEEMASRQAFFPLTVPLTTGPGSIAAGIALAAERESQLLLGSVMLAVLVAGTVAPMIWIAYRNAGAVARRLGPQGTLIATKVSAFLLLCVGVQIVLTGVGDALRRIFPNL